MSGVLGAAAWMLGPYLGTDNFYSLLILWQVCIAPLLGFVLDRPGLRLALPSSELS